MSTICPNILGEKHPWNWGKRSLFPGNRTPDLLHQRHSKTRASARGPLLPLEVAGTARSGSARRQPGAASCRPATTSIQSNNRRNAQRRKLEHRLGLPLSLCAAALQGELPPTSCPALPLARPPPSITYKIVGWFHAPSRLRTLKLPRCCPSHETTVSYLGWPRNGPAKIRRSCHHSASSWISHEDGDPG